MKPCRGWPSSIFFVNRSKMGYVIFGLFNEVRLDHLATKCETNGMNPKILPTARSQQLPGAVTLVVGVL